MSCWTKEQLENMLEDVVNELDLSEAAIETHGPLGTAPAELVRLVLEEKDRKIRLLQRGLIDLSAINSGPDYRALYEQEKALREAAEDVIAAGLKQTLSTVGYSKAYDHYKQLKQQYNGKL